MKRNFFLTIAIYTALFLFSLNLSAEESPISGSLSFYSAVDALDTNYYRNAVNANLIFRKAFNQTAFYADLAADYDSALSSETVRSLYSSSATSSTVESVNRDIKDSQTRIYLREGYINQDFHVTPITILDSFSFKAGKIITKWGLSEFFSPLDIINPQDYSFGIMKSLEERKNGVYAFNPSLYFSQHFFIEGIINPVFEADNEYSSSFEHANMTTLNNQVTQYNAIYDGEELPDTELSDSTYAARMGLLFQVFEAHLVYYRGYDHSPVYSLSQTGDIVTSTAEYKRLNMVGFDFLSSLVWDINLKGEAAYYHTGKCFAYNTESQSVDIAYGGDGYYNSRFVKYDVGFEVVKDNSRSAFLINFEFNQNIIVDHKSVLEDKQVENRMVGELQYRFAKKRAYLKNMTLYCIEDSDLGSQVELGLKPEQNYLVKTGCWIFHGFDGKTGDMGSYSDQDFFYFGGDMLF